MTRQTFYRWLKRTQSHAEWYVAPPGPARRTAAHCGFDVVCPLGALPGAIRPLPIAPFEVGGALSQDDMAAIFRAADNFGDSLANVLVPSHDPRVRAALLRNLGLTEVTT